MICSHPKIVKVSIKVLEARIFGGTTSMPAAQSWKEKWTSVNSKFATCKSECVTNYRSDQLCKDSIEATISDIWNLKDWLVEDVNAHVSRTEIYDFLINRACHITACGDIETKQKHYKVKNQHHEPIELIWEGKHNHPSGFPVIFSVTRIYKDGTGKDCWEDAYELLRRAIEQWREFLKEKGLL